MQILTGKEVDGAVLLRNLTRKNYKQWGKDINDPENVKKLLENKKIVGKLMGVELYKAAGEEYGIPCTYYFTINDGKKYAHLKYDIPFFSKVVQSTSRNKVFRSGLHQAIVWKAPSYMYACAFAVRFLDYLVDTTGAVVMTDMQQSDLGADMWVNALSLLQDKYDCYYALSAPSDAKCVIKINSLADVNHYDEDIVSDTLSYAYRTAFLIKKTVPLQNVLYDYNRTLILTCQEAEELGAFDSPENLTQVQEQQVDNEMYLMENTDTN